MSSSQANAPWRALALLAVLVVAAHALLLGTSPKRFGSEPNPSSPQARAFVTRSIERPPPPVAAAPVKPLAKPVAKPVKVPASKEKEAVAQEERAQPATDLIASPAPEATASSPEAPATAASEPAQATDPTAAASAPLPPAGLTPVTAMALPESARLKYAMTSNAKGMNWHADAELAWQNSGSSYSARMNVSALFLGSRSMSSSGQVGPEGLAPERFTDKTRSEVAAHFEPDKGQISFSTNTPAVPWLKGAQDRASVYFQLGGMLAGSPESFPVGSSISLYTVGPRDADTWTFVVEAEENIKLPFGELASLKLTRQPRREYDTKVEIWYAPSLGYLPVRNKITQSSGDFADQQLSDVSKP